MRTTHSALCLLCALGCVALLSCKPSSPAQDSSRTVVLYSSVDEPILRPIIEAFEPKTGIIVKLASDTEATKTTGLATRLLTERARPRADVWWSSEPLWTVRLSKENVFEPIDQSLLDTLAVQTDWPQTCVGVDNLWVGFALRARVLAYNTTAVKNDALPGTLAELSEEQWQGRVGMAKPEFGTTRAHMAALVHAWGAHEFETWLAAMRDNGLRLYDGNSSAVRAVALGEIDVCLTDTDDVWNAQAQAWPVGIIYEAVDQPVTTDARWPTQGPLVLANTVAKVRNPKNTAEAHELIAFLLSETTERLLAESTSRNVPIRPQLAEALFVAHPESRIEQSWLVHPRDLAAAENEALAIVGRVLR